MAIRDWANGDYFPDPEDLVCPPPEAKAEDVDLYRFTKNDPPKKCDYKCYAEREKWREDHKNNFREMCQGCGFSFYYSLEEAKEAAARLKKLGRTGRKYSHICKVSSTATDGAHCYTGSHHHATFWCRNGIMIEERHHDRVSEY